MASGATSYSAAQHTPTRNAPLNVLELDARERNAFAATPFVASLLWFMYTASLLLITDGLDLRGTFQFLIGACTLGLLVGFALTYIAALPVYLILRATLGVTGLIARSAGTAIGALVGVTLASGGGYPGPIAGGVLGWAIAAVWWKIARKPRDLGSV